MRGRSPRSTLLPYTTLFRSDVDSSRLAREVGAPDVLEQRVAGQHDARVPGQRCEKVELARPELQTALVDVGLAATRVDPQRADLDRAGTGCRRGRPPEDRLDSCNQGTWVEWLRDVVVGAQLKPDDRVDVVRPRGQHENRGRPAPADLATHLEPVDARQHQVQDDEVRVVAGV